MLVLSRKVGETIRIGDNVEIMVVAIKPCGAVRLGINAPREIKVLRSEIIRDELGEIQDRCDPQE